MSRIDTIFFDWGGVIADDPGDDFLKDLLKRLGATDTQTQEIYDGYMRQFLRGEINEDAYWQMIREHYGLTVHENISDDFKNWRGLITNEAVFSLVDAARAEGIRPALLTNVIEPTYGVLDAAGYYAKFDAVIASCKVGYAKPQPEIYQLALDRLETTAERSLFIDDKQRNLDPAAAMGFRTILAENPAQIIADVNRYIHAV